MLVIRGPDKEETFNKKVRAGPIWISSGQVHITGVPSLFLSFSPAPVRSFRELHIDLGGPVVKDRFWYYGAYNYFKIDKVISGRDPDVATDVGLFNEITGKGVTYQQLGYMMRCGAPDALDRMVAMNFGNLAMDMLLDGVSGLMTALQDGKYTTVGLNSVIEGVKRVEVDRFYDEQEYKPVIRRVQNLPMFLR